MHLLIFYLETLKCDRCWACKTLSSGSVKYHHLDWSRINHLISLNLSFPFVKEAELPVLPFYDCVIASPLCPGLCKDFWGLTWGLYFNYSFSFAIEVYLTYSFILVSYIQCNGSVFLCVTSLITICQHIKLLQYYWLYFLCCTLHPFILILLMTHLNISCLGSSPEASVTLTSPNLLLPLAEVRF